MNNIIKSNTIRKACYSTMLLGLVFSTLGASNLSVHTKEVTESLVTSGISVISPKNTQLSQKKMPTSDTEHSIVATASPCPLGASYNGNAMPQSFFTDVLSDMGYSNAQFALDAFTKRNSTDPLEWEQYEGTGACFNPLATTLDASIIGNGCTDTWYNTLPSGGHVMNYSSQWCGEQATAHTILHTTVHTSNDYWAIQDFLSGTSFNSDFTNSSSDAIYSELVEWVGSTGYAIDLRNQWWSLWNNERGGGGGGGSAPSSPSSPNPSDGSTLGRTSDTYLDWSTTGTSCDVHIWGGNININPSGGSCSSLHLGNQYGGAYQWQVTAHNSYGTTTGPTWHFNVQPYAPSNLNASAPSQTQINLSWTKSGDDPGSVDSYNIYRNGTNIANVAAGSTSYQAGGLTCNTNYSFYITAVRQGVESTASNTASATTSSCGSVPSTPSSPNPSDGSTLGRTTSITLYWNTSGTSCDINILGGPSININQNAISCASFFFGQQWPGSYQWHVTAHNSNGTTTGPTWHFNVQPYAPSNLSASAASQTQINLSWTKSSDDPSSVDAYNVYYSNGSSITSVGAGSTSAQVGGLTCNTGYSFYVKAVRQGVESSASNTASATTNACITNTAPNTPSNLIISSQTAYSITLAWNAVSNETGYKIYRWDGGTETFVYLASVGANTTSFIETRSTCGWDQYYEVSAYNNYGESALTGWVHGYTLSCPTAAPSAQFDVYPYWGGTAPFSEQFHIVNMDYIVSCAWNYGDGQTSNICTQLHDHVYTNAGTYIPSLTVTGSGGQNTYTLPSPIIVTAAFTGSERTRNGGFNTYVGKSNIPQYWTASKFQTTDGKDLTVFEEGTASVKITGKSGVTKTLTQTLTLKGNAGDKFLFSFQTQGSSIPVAGVCEGQVKLYNGKKLISTQTIKCATGTYGFQLNTLNFTAPKSYTKVVIVFTYKQASGTVWFDAVSLLK